jgi:nucleoside-diphosphate-sugar epimerase
MRILVTGAAGFIGYHLCRVLAADADVEVVGVDDGSRGTIDADYEALGRRRNVRLLKLDLNDQSQVRQLPGQVDCVYHLAALNGTQNFYERPLDVLRSCTMPTVNLLDRYGRSGDLERFVFAGTSESYASTVSKFDWPVPTDEDVPLSIDDVLNPRWSYAAGKINGEVAAFAAARQHGTAVTVIRYHNVYGPRMGDKHVIPDFLARARDGIYELWGYEDTRSFLYVDDAVSATVRLGTCVDAEGAVVNVGSDREVRILELGRMMMETCGFEGEIMLHPSPPGSVPRRCPDITKLRELIGFDETSTLDEGLRETARYYIGQVVQPTSRARARLAAGDRSLS